MDPDIIFFPTTYATNLCARPQSKKPPNGSLSISTPAPTTDTHYFHGDRIALLRLRLFRDSLVGREKKTQTPTNLYTICSIKNAGRTTTIHTSDYYATHTHTVKADSCYWYRNRTAWAWPRFVWARKAQLYLHIDAWEIALRRIHNTEPTFPDSRNHNYNLSARPSKPQDFALSKFNYRIGIWSTTELLLIIIILSLHWTGTSTLTVPADIFFVWKKAPPAVASENAPF